MKPRKKTTKRRRSQKRNGPVTNGLLAVAGLAALGGAAYVGITKLKDEKGERPEQPEKGEECEVTITDRHSISQLANVLEAEPPVSKADLRERVLNYFGRVFPECPVPAKVHLEYTSPKKSITLDAYIETLWEQLFAEGDDCVVTITDWHINSLFDMVGAPDNEAELRERLLEYLGWNFPDCRVPKILEIEDYPKPLEAMTIDEYVRRLWNMWFA